MHEKESIWFAHISRKFTQEELKKAAVLSLLDFIPSELGKGFLGSAHLMERITAEMLVCTDMNRNIYQFCDVSRQALQRWMKTIEATETEQLYLSSGQWFGKRGYGVSALQCYYSAGAYERCMELIFDLVPTRMSAESGKIIKGIIEAFPEEFREQQPVIDVVYASLHFLTLEFDKMIPALEDIIQRYKQQPERAEESQALCDAYLTLAMLQMMQGNTEFPESLRRARQHQVGSSMVYGRKFMLLNNGNAITLKDGAAGELEAWQEAVRVGEPLLHGLIHSGYGFHQLVRARAAHLRGEGEDAQLYVNLAMQEGKARGQADITCSCYALLNEIAVAQGDYEKALRVLKEMWEYVLPLRLPAAFQLPDIAQSWFYTKVRDLRKVPGWNTGEAVFSADRFLVTVGVERIIYAECLFSEGRYEEAMKELDETEQIYQVRHLILQQISVYVLRALIYDKWEAYEQCREVFEQVYQLAAPNQLIMPVAEAGRDICLLIEHIRAETACEIPEHWLDDLYIKAAIYEKNIKQVRQEHTARCNMDRSERSLSELEYTILKGLSEGLSLGELAEQTGNNMQFIRNYMKRIYVKLDAVNAVHAVKIAYAENLI